MKAAFFLLCAFVAVTGSLWSLVDSLSQPMWRLTCVASTVCALHVFCLYLPTVKWKRMTITYHRPGVHVELVKDAK